MIVCLSACLSVCLAVCLYVCRPACLPVCMSVCVRKCWLCVFVVSRGVCVCCFVLFRVVLWCLAVSVTVIDIARIGVVAIAFVFVFGVVVDLVRVASPCVVLFCCVLIGSIRCVLFLVWLVLFRFAL